MARAEGQDRGQRGHHRAQGPDTAVPSGPSGSVGSQALESLSICTLENQLESCVWTHRDSHLCRGFCDHANVGTLSPVSLKPQEALEIPLLRPGRRRPRGLWLRALFLNI